VGGGRLLRPRLPTERETERETARERERKGGRERERERESERAREREREGSFFDNPEVTEGRKAQRRVG